MTKKFKLIFIIASLLSFESFSQKISLEGLELLLHNKSDFINSKLTRLGFDLTPLEDWHPNNAETVVKNRRWVINEKCAETDKCEYCIIAIPLIKTIKSGKIETFFHLSTNNQTVYTSLFEEIKGLGMKQKDSEVTAWGSTATFIDEAYIVGFETKRIPSYSTSYIITINQK